MASRQHIAEWLGAQGAGAGAETEIGRVASADEASPDSVVFAATALSLQTALRSSAALILTTTDLASGFSDPRLLLVAEPRLAFSVVADRLRFRGQPAIHPTAVVDPTAEIDLTVTVGAGAVIGAKVRIGPDTTIGPRAVLESNITVGARVVVQSGAVLGSFGFGYARRPDGTYLLFPQQGTLVIEDDVEVGANSTIDRGALGETRIGAGTKIDNLVHIGHNCRIGRNVILAAQTGISGSTVVEDGAVLGGQVGIGEHAHVGKNVILGGGAGVLSNKKLHGPGQVFWGRPAQPLKQYLRDLARLRKGGSQ